MNPIHQDLGKIISFLAANEAYVSFAATFFSLTRYFCAVNAFVFQSLELWQQMRRRSELNMRLLFTLLAAFICVQTFAQKPDSLQVIGADSTSPASFFPIRRDSFSKNQKMGFDTLVFKEKKKGVAFRVFTKGYPNPRTAALLSAVLPGAGQAYNKKWWKIPLVWGSLGGIGYYTIETQKTYRELRDNYKLLVDGDPDTNPTESPYNTFDAPRTKNYRDTFKGYTEKWYIALGVTYLLAITDAFVDAHLSRFDVSDDLTMRLKPSLETSAGLPVFGLGISFSISKAQPRPPLTFTAHP